jgi:lipopolysaccharide assembly outer membrane protein LptD (OstA)
MRDALTALSAGVRHAVPLLFIIAGLTSAQPVSQPAPDINTSANRIVNSQAAAQADTSTNLTDSAATAAADSIPGNKNEVADTVHYEADFIDYDNEERVLSLYGRAWIRYQNITLRADTVVYTVSNNQFQARGAPTLIEGGDTTVGDFMVYNIKTRRGRVSYAITRFEETYVTGSNIVKTPENCLYIEQGDYTSCENPEHPHYYFYGRHVKFIPQDKVVSRPVVLNVGDAPVAVLPFFVMPLQRGRRSGWLTPSWGGSVARGGYVDHLGYYFAPNDYYDATLSAKVQEFNSFVFNASGRYALRYVLDGQVSGRYVVDNRLENSSRQWALDYRHNQFLTPDGRTRLSGYGNIISNRTFNQLYSDETYELEKQQLDANMSLSHRFDKINASANLIWRRNHNLTTDRIIEDMPSLDFSLQNRAFVPFNAGGAKSDPSWYNNIYYSYNTRANLRRDAYGNDSLPGFTRPGMEHNVNLNSSQKVLKYLDISPYFNMRSSMFYGAIDTLVKKTLYVRDTLVYRVSDPSRDTRAPDYTLISSTPEYFINEDGDLDTVYTIVKVSPERQHLVRDTLDEFSAVNSWNAGVNMSTRIYGMFPIGLCGVTAVRHTMTPTVGYAFVPKHELDRTFYNVGINYDQARPKAQQLMNFSLSNQFQGKRVVSAGDNKNDNKGRNNRSNNSGNNNAGGINSLSGISSVNSVDDATGAGIDNVSVIDGSEGRDGSDNLDDDSEDSDNEDGDGADVNAGKKNTAAARREVKFDIVSLTLSTSYNFEAEERRWRDLSLNANTNISILNVGYSSTFWFYDEPGNLTLPVMKDYSVDLTSGRLGASGKFWDGDLMSLDLTKPGDYAALSKAATQSWNVGFSPSFSYRARRNSPQDRFLPTKSFNLSSTANVNLTRAISARWNGNYDFSSNRFSHNNFTFTCDLECWEMRFTWRPEKINPGFHFVVNIKKIPDIKWEQKESRTTRVL